MPLCRCQDGVDLRIIHRLLLRIVVVDAYHCVGAVALEDFVRLFVLVVVVVVVVVVVI